MPDKDAPSDSPSDASPAPVRSRLPWWAAVLPVLAFVLLLTPLLGGSGADAAQHSGNAVGEILAAVLEQIAYALLRG
jgi:hypothetical protein